MNMISVLLIVITLGLTGCSSNSLIKYSLDSPPLVLTSVSHANIEDGRGRFREIYCELQRDHGRLLPNDRPCEEVLLNLSNEPAPTFQKVAKGITSHNIRVIVIPGIFSECIYDYVETYSDARAYLKTLKYKTDFLQVSGRSSSSSNAGQIYAKLDAIVKEESKLPDTDRNNLILIGYSKGTADILEFLQLYPDLNKEIKAVVSIAGVVSGSPIADSIDEPYVELLNKVTFPKCAPPGDEDIGAIVSLRRGTRLAWLANNKLPSIIKYFSLVAFDNKDGISTILQPFNYKLSEIDPRNDGQVIFYDAIIPGSTLLGYVKADHWAVSMPFLRENSQYPALPSLLKPFVEHNAFPREILLEAVVRFVEEKIGTE